MKPIPLQLITVKLDNGQHGIFVGSPLISNQQAMSASQVSEIWFSDIRDLPDKMDLEELMALIHEQLGYCKEQVH